MAKMKVLVLGAGGHAQVVADILLRMEDAGEPIRVVGFLDDDPGCAGQRPLGLPVLGDIAQLPRIPHDGLIVGIGDNETRRLLYESVRRAGETLVTARHPRSIIAPGVEIGSGSMICAGAVVNPQSRIGPNVILNTGCSVDHHNDIGPHVHIAPGAHLGGDVTIGQGVLVGIGATVMPGLRVGDGSVVGAGAVADKDVPPGVVVVGVPARILRRRPGKGPLHSRKNKP